MTEDRDKVIVSDFLSIAGGVVRGGAPGDIDVVVRAEFIGDKLTVPADSVLLQVRNYIAERTEVDRHDLPIHIIPEPTGPHSDYIPLADLVLRFKPGAVVEVKSNRTANFIHFVGTGPSEPIHRDTRWNTATLVNISGVNLLVDAPSGIAERLAQMPDAVLVTHQHSDACSGVSELDATVYAPEQIGEHEVVLVVPGAPFRVKDVIVTPFRVVHGDVTTVGYRMEGSGIAVAVAHDIAEIPEESLKFFDGAIAVVDAAGWDHPVFDHWAVAEHLAELRDAGALYVYLTQVGRSVPEEPDLPAWAELAHDGMVVPLEKTEKALWPMKPAVPFYFENFSAAQMWEAWGHSHAPFAVEPKWNGWRFRVAIDEDGVRATTESGKDVSSYLVGVVKQLRLPGGPVELDGELLMVANGRIVPRHLMPAVLSARQVDWTAHPRFFDILSGGGVNKDTPYRERRKVLEKIVPEEFLTPITIVRNEQELERAFERFGFAPGSEGIVAKDLDSTITGGPSQSWSKVKRMLEVRARVVSAERKENGWSYDCEWADGHPTGKTMVTRIQAKPGDVVTVLCQELVQSGDTLKFQNAVVTDVNEGRPLTLQEAMRVVLEHANAKPARKLFAGGPMPFRGLGTKARLAGKILELFTDHEIYCEPFVGSLGFFARKPKVKGIQEIISDLDEVKYRCYRFLQRASEGQIAEVVDEIANVRPGRVVQEEVRHGKPRSDREAFRLMLLGNFFMRGREIPYPPFVSFNPNPGTYFALKHRLAGVKILHKDALDVIRSLRNNPNVLFYLDPPYATADHAVYYREQFDKQKFLELLELLKTIKGKFILSCYQRDLAGFKVPASWHVYRVRVYTITPHGGGHATNELLITNYEPEKGKWLESVRDRIVELPKVSETGKALVEEEEDEVKPGPTRSARAQASWEAKWHEYYPKTGVGQFIIQRHIRGLEEHEVKNPPPGHSVHYDIRMTAGDGRYLFGFTIFSDGSSQNLLESLLSGETLRCTPKQPQPIEWLEVGKGEPFISSPGEVGSTTQKYARFDAVDWGQYSAGTWNRHSVEVVIRGRKERPIRLLFQRIQPGVWTVRAGGDPIARHETVEQIRARLAKRGHEVFFYRDPLSDKPPLKVSIKGWLGKTVRQWPHLPWKIFLTLLPRLRSGAICYKIVGNLVILPVTNRFLDLQGDFVTKQAVQSLLEHPPRNATVRIAHKDGTDIADLIAFIPYKRFVFGIGKFRNTPKARFFKNFLARYPTGHPTIAPHGWATSIGFWGVRDPNDPSQIAELRLREVSILPAGTAANPWTTFPIDQKEEE
jgi:DNA adenine methylase